MFILYPILFGLIISYILGGRLNYLIEHPLYWKLVAILAFAIQIMIFSDIPFLEALSDTANVVLHYASYILLIIFVIRNIKTPGIALIGAGIFSNSLVIFLNGGYMPTLPENLKYTSFAGHSETISQGVAVHNSSLIDSQTLLPWLGDIFYLPSWIPLSNVFSLGDVIIGLGIIIYLLLNMKPAKSSYKYAYFVEMYRKR
jgi:hypothetical protein